MWVNDARQPRHPYKNAFGTDDRCQRGDLAEPRQSDTLGNQITWGPHIIELPRDTYGSHLNDAYSLKVEDVSESG